MIFFNFKKVFFVKKRNEHLYKLKDYKSSENMLKEKTIKLTLASV